MTKLNLKSLSDDQLLESTHAVVREERRIGIDVLWHLQEVEARMLYAKEGYPNLFEYCISDLKYSNPAAWRRISAMRLLNQIPEVQPALESGELSVTTLSQAQSYFNQEKRAGHVLSLQEKRVIVDQICGKSSDTVERQLAALSPLPHPVEKARVLDASHTELKIVLDSETMSMLKRFEEVTSHTNAGASKASLLKHALKIALSKIDPELKRDRKIRSTKTVGSAAKPTQTLGLFSKPFRRVTRYIPAHIEQAVRERDAHKCTYLNTETGRRCGSKYFTQLDHIIAFALGGPHTITNLRLRCHAHNKLHAQNLQKLIAR